MSAPAKFNLDYLRSAKPNAWPKTLPEELSQQSLKRFFDLGLPDRRHEDWRYTRIGDFFAEPLGLQTPTASSASPMTRDPLFIDLHFVNGQCVSPQASALGAEILPLSRLEEAEEPWKEWVLRQWTQSTLTDDALLALNGALACDGYMIRLRPQSKVELPIRIFFQQTEKGVLGALRNFIWLEEEAELSVLEVFEGDGAASLNTALTQVVLARGARLNWARSTGNSRHVGMLEVEQHEASQFHALGVARGGELSRQSWKIQTSGPSTQSVLNGLSLASDSHHIDNCTAVIHRHVHGESQQLFKGVLLDKARSVFSGKIHIAKDAQFVKSSQHNHNLLLSEGAEADTKPALEIFADDVKANHGASVGQLDEDQLFYLRSRSIDPITATKLLAFGYVHDVLFKFPSRPIVDFLTQRVDQQFIQFLGNWKEPSHA